VVGSIEGGSAVSGSTLSKAYRRPPLLLLGHGTELVWKHNGTVQWTLWFRHFCQQTFEN
jgi:hypothetical protein